MNDNLFYRSNPLKIRSDGGTVQLSFSSEQPVTRWFGTEILLHNPGNIDLTRLQAVGSLIYGHDPGKLENVLGKITRAWIEERRGKAEVQMDTDPVGKAALVKIQSGSIKGVSVGYMIDQAQRIEEGETWSDPDSGQTFTGPGMIATRWTPYEISLTPIPADATVGIGREATRSLDGIQIINSSTRKETFKMDQETVKALAAKILESVRNTEKERRDLIGHARMISADAAAYAEKALKEGRKVEEIQRHLLDMAGIVPGGKLNQQGRITSFKQISDDDFFRSLADPAPNNLDEGTAPHGGTTSFRNISDDEFFAGLTNPAEYGGR